MERAKRREEERWGGFEKKVVSGRRRRRRDVEGKDRPQHGAHISWEGGRERGFRVWERKGVSGRGTCLLSFGSEHGVLPYKNIK